MIKNILSDTGGIGIYGVISLCLFFLVFAGALVWSFIQKRGFCDHMSSLPLQHEKGDNSHE